MNERDKELAIAAGIYTNQSKMLETFADLIRADEREVFVAFIQSYPHWLGNKAKEEIVQAIRARGNT